MSISVNSCSERSKQRKRLKSLFPTKRFQNIRERRLEYKKHVKTRFSRGFEAFRMSGTTVVRTIDTGALVLRVVPEWCRIAGVVDVAELSVIGD